MVVNLQNNAETEIKFSFVISSVATEQAHVYLKIQAG